MSLLIGNMEESELYWPEKTSRKILIPPLSCGNEEATSVRLEGNLATRQLIGSARTSE